MLSADIQTADIYKGVEVRQWVEDAPDLPFYITGSWWKNEREDTYRAEADIIRAARNRNADVEGDSEGSQFFLNARELADAHILIDVLEDQGRLA